VCWEIEFAYPSFYRFDRELRVALLLELLRLVLLREPAARELFRAFPPSDVVRLLRAAVPRDAPLRELDERDSLARLRVLLRPLLVPRPRALDDFLAWAERPASAFFFVLVRVVLVREPPPLERELRDELFPVEPRREELVAVDFRPDELLPPDAEVLLRELCDLPPLLLLLERERPERPVPVCWAVSRLTSLLKLLRCPPAVVS